MTIVATPGAVDANSYCTLTEANTYHGSRLFSDTWNNATDGNKEKALLWATRLLDRETWVGYRTNEIQALRWPRVDVYDHDGYYIDSTVVPQFLKEAEAELAMALLGSDRTQETGTEGFAKIEVGPIKLEMKADDRVDAVSKEVYEMIKGYIERGSTRMQRG